MAIVPEETSAPRGPGRPKDEGLAARRREEVLDVAMLAFAENGYRQTDLQVVAERLGVGKGTIYRYFPTKEQLFLAAVDRGIQQLRDSIHAATDKATDPVEHMRIAVHAYLAYFDRNPHVVELLILERAEFKDRGKPTYFVYQEANSERGKAVLRQLQQQGRLRPLPVEAVLDVLADMLYGAIFTNYFSGRRKSLEMHAEEILSIALHGILAPE